MKSIGQPLRYGRPPSLCGTRYDQVASVPEFLLLKIFVKW